MTPHRALLLDVGRVILDVTPRALGAYDAAVGRAPVPDGLVPDRGEGALAAMARARGLDGPPGLFRAVARVVPDQLFDADAVELMRHARAAGRRVGVLSNDAYTYVGREFFTDRPEFAALDAFVDSTEVGVRKPAPRAYMAAAEALGVAPHDVVFLDDTPECVDGARAVGMVGVLVDPGRRRAAFDQARTLLGLPPRDASAS